MALTRIVLPLKPAILQGYYVAIEQTALLQQTHVKP